MNTPSDESILILETLKKAVDKALDKKKRLGQYAVVWKDNKPLLIGEDAPKQESQNLGAQRLSLNIFTVLLPGLYLQMLD